MYCKGQLGAIVTPTVNNDTVVRIDSQIILSAVTCVICIAGLLRTDRKRHVFIVARTSIDCRKHV